MSPPTNRGSEAVLVQRILLIIYMCLFGVLLPGQAGCPPDADGDGYPAGDGVGEDCKDDNSDIHPGAAEGPTVNGVVSPDGIDNDCDEIIDEDTVVYDDDGDGACEGGTDPRAPCVAYTSSRGATVPVVGDCDDRSFSVYPGAPERCNQIDDDCDGLTDEVGAGEAPCAYHTRDCDVELTGVRCSTDRDCGSVSGDAACSLTGEGLAGSDSTPAALPGVCGVYRCEVPSSYASGAHASLVGDGLPCNADADCSLGAHCSTGVCFVECQEASQCGTGGACTDYGRCAECSTDNECAGSTTCEPSGMCSTTAPALADQLSFVRCDMPEERVDTVYFASEDSEVTLCLLLESSASTSATATLSTYTSQRVGGVATEALVRLDLSGFTDASPSLDGSAWHAELPLGALQPIVIRGRDFSNLDYLGASATLIASTRGGEARLTTRAMGSVSGAFKGAVEFDYHSGSASEDPGTWLTRPGRSLNLLIAPDPSPSRPLALLLDAGSDSDDPWRVLGAVTVDGQSGQVSVRWRERIDRGALALASETGLPATLVSRPVYREMTLVGNFQEGGTLAGTFTQITRGLAARDIVLTGGFELERSSSMERTFAGAIEAYQDYLNGLGAMPAMWSQADDYASAFTAAGLPTGSAPDAECSPYLAGGGSLLQKADCLYCGDAADGACAYRTPGASCGFAGRAFALGAYLEGSAVTDGEHYASTGVCDVELGTSFRGTPSTSQCLPYTTEIGAGACEVVSAPSTATCSGGGYGYTRGDPTFQACCADPNRLDCSAQTYTYMARVGATGADREAAFWSQWAPLSDFLGAHAYDAQELRLLSEPAYLYSESSATSPSMAAFMGDQNAVLSRMNPAWALLTSPLVMEGLGAVDASFFRDCALYPDLCDYPEFASSVLDGLSLEASVLGRLAELNLREAGPQMTDRARVIRQELELGVELGFYVAHLDVYAGAAPMGTGAATSEGISQRVQDLVGSTSGAALWVHQTLRSLNEWGLPRTYIPNPMLADENGDGVADGDFIERRNEALEAVRALALLEADLEDQLTSRLSSAEDEQALLCALYGRSVEQQAQVCGTTGAFIPPLPGCTQPLPEPQPASVCGYGGVGTVWEAYDALLAALDAYDLADQDLQGHVEIIDITQGEADSVLLTLLELRESYQAHSVQLDGTLGQLEVDFAERFYEHFQAYQQEMGSVYDEMAAMYEDLYAQAASLRGERMEEAKETLNARCEAMAVSITALAEERASIKTTEYEKKISCVDAASRRTRDDRGSRYRRYDRTGDRCRKFPINVVACARSTRLDNWYKYSESEESETECINERCQLSAEADSQQDMIDVAADEDRSKLQFDCAESSEELANQAQLELDAMAREEQTKLAEWQAQLDLQVLQSWYDYRSQMMKAALEQQSAAAIRAHEQKNLLSDTDSEIMRTRAQYATRIGVLLAEMDGMVLRGRQAMSQLESAERRYLELLRQAEMTEAEAGRYHRALSQQTSADPIFRVVETGIQDDVQRQLSHARMEAWFAMQSLSYELAMDIPASYERAMQASVTAHQLCGVVTSCLDESLWDSVRNATGSPQPTFTELSVRRLLGLDQEVVNPQTGLVSTAADRFGEFLADGRQTVGVPQPSSGSVYQTQSLRLQLANDPYQALTTMGGVYDDTYTVDMGGSSVWDSLFCAQKLDSIRAAVVCEDCPTDVRRMWFYMVPGDVTLSYACDDAGRRVYHTLPGGAASSDAYVLSSPPRITVEAVVVRSEADVEAALASAVPSEGFSGLDAILPELELSIVPPALNYGNGENARIPPVKVNDVWLRLDYSRRQAQRSLSLPACSLSAPIYATSSAASCGR